MPVRTKGIDWGSFFYIYISLYIWKYLFEMTKSINRIDWIDAVSASDDPFIENKYIEIKCTMEYWQQLKCWLKYFFFYFFGFDLVFTLLKLYIFLWKINYSNKFSYLNHSKKVLIEINPSVLMYTIVYSQYSGWRRIESV